MYSQKINDVWTVKGKTEDDATTYVEILKFLFLQLEPIFGDIENCGEACTIKNDETSECPILLYDKPATMKLAQENSDYWAQTIFQMSHELTHYYLRQYKANMHINVKWFEETLCESMSLVALNLSAKNWNACTLSNKNPSFDVALRKYLNSELEEPEKSVLTQCRTIVDLQNVENTCTKNRAGRVKERNYLYREIIKGIESFNIIRDYPKYINSDCLTIDFDRWYVECQLPAILTLQNIHPVLDS